jgi:hypothetical protein
VEQHNQHAALAEFNVAPLEESMKIHYYKDRVTDSSINSIKSTIMFDCQQFQEFDNVMQFYVNFKRSQKPDAPANQACNVSAVQGHGSGRQGCGESSGGS